MIVCNQVMKFILDKIEKDEKQAAKKRKKEEVVEQKRSRQNATKLTALLYKHKEQLKAEILKKRALLDKELQLQVQVRARVTCSNWEVHLSANRRKSLHIEKKLLKITLHLSIIDNADPLSGRNKQPLTFHVDSHSGNSTDLCEDQQTLKHSQLIFSIIFFYSYKVGHQNPGG